MPPLLNPLPLWSKIHSTIANIAEVTTLTIRHAQAVADSTCAVKAVVEAKEQREILRFKAMGGDDVDDVTGEADDESVSSNASFSAHLASGLARVFCIPSLCPKQTAAVKGITIHPDLKGRLLVVDRTGVGESYPIYDGNMCRRSYAHHHSAPSTHRQSAIVSPASSAGLRRRLRVSS